MPTVLIILPEGFEEVEAITPIDVLRRAGAEVTIAALGEKPAVKGKHNITVQADCLLSAVPASRVFDLLILPGGPGVKKLRADLRITATIKSLSIARLGVVAIVVLDPHKQLTIDPCDREQAFTLFALHALECQCRGCRLRPHDRRSWPRPLRAWRWLKRTFTGNGRRPRHSPKQPTPEAASGK